MNKAMQIIREVNIQADHFYPDAIKFGDHAAYALTKAHRSQLTELENIAESALKISDILDYVKRQTARFDYWQKSFPQSEQSDIGFGERLKDYLENDLAQKRDILCGPKRLNLSEKTDEGQNLRRRVYLLLIRQFLRQMVVQYEYRVSMTSPKKKGV